MQQTFPVELKPRINLTRVSGDLEVKGWERREIRLDFDDQGCQLSQEGNVLTLLHCGGDIELSVPFDTEIRVEGLGGEVQAQDILRIELKEVGSDVDLKNIGTDAHLENIGEAISLTDIAGDLLVRGAASLRARRKIGGDATVEDVPLVEIEMVGADLDMRQIALASVGNVGGDLDLTELSEALRCGNVGGDCQISDSSSAEINLGNVGGDLEIAGATLLHLGNAGGDAKIQDVQSVVHIGNVGGDTSIIGVGSDLTVGRIGSDARLRGLAGSIRVGGIGGDLELQASFPAEGQAHLNVGGDANILLPIDANLALQATVGGSISGPAVSFSGHGSLVRLVYGAGATHVNLSVGGDLKLQGGGNPQVSSANMPWGEFGQEMSELGQEMARMGQELGQEFKNIFGDMGWTGVAWTDEMTRKVEEQVRRARQKAEQHARKAEERSRQAEQRAWQAQERARQRADRVHVRVNEREWQMNPERLNDLVNRAQQATMEGVAGAMEAVERAVGNLRIPHPPQPPTPGWSPAGVPVPPTPPMPPTAVPRPPQPPTPGWSPMSGSMPPMPPMPPVGFASDTPGPEPAADTGSQTESAPDLEQEREAILRMIAEGRITPEEGDMLLEGLGG